MIILFPSGIIAVVPKLAVIYPNSDNSWGNFKSKIFSFKMLAKFKIFFLSQSETITTNSSPP